MNQCLRNGVCRDAENNDSKKARFRQLTGQLKKTIILGMRIMMFSQEERE